MASFVGGKKFDKVESVLSGLVDEVREWRDRRKVRGPEDLRRMYVDECPIGMYSCEPSNLPGLDCPTPDPSDEPLLVTRRGICFTKKKWLESLPGYGRDRPPTIASILNHLVNNLHLTIAKLSAEDPQLLAQAVQEAAAILGDGVVTKPAGSAMRSVKSFSQLLLEAQAVTLDDTNDVDGKKLDKLKDTASFETFFRDGNSIPNFGSDTVKQLQYLNLGLQKVAAQVYDDAKTLYDDKKTDFDKVLKIYNYFTDSFTTASSVTSISDSHAVTKPELDKKWREFEVVVEMAVNTMSNFKDTPIDSAWSGGIIIQFQRMYDTFKALKDEVEKYETGKKFDANDFEKEAVKESLTQWVMPSGQRINDEITAILEPLRFRLNNMSSFNYSDEENAKNLLKDYIKAIEVQLANESSMKNFNIITKSLSDKTSIKMETVILLSLDMVNLFEFLKDLKLQVDAYIKQFDLDNTTTNPSSETRDIGASSFGDETVIPSELSTTEFTEVPVGTFFGEDTYKDKDGNNLPSALDVLTNLKFPKAEKVDPEIFNAWISQEDFLPIFKLEDTLYNKIKDEFSLTFVMVNRVGIIKTDGLITSIENVVKRWENPFLHTGENTDKKEFEDLLSDLLIIRQSVDEGKQVDANHVLDVLDKLAYKTTFFRSLLRDNGLPETMDAWKLVSLGMTNKTVTALLTEKTKYLKYREKLVKPTKYEEDSSGRVQILLDSKDTVDSRVSKLNLINEELTRIQESADDNPFYDIPSMNPLLDPLKEIKEDLELFNRTADNVKELQPTFLETLATAVGLGGTPSEPTSEKEKSEFAGGFVPLVDW